MSALPHFSSVDKNPAAADSCAGEPSAPAATAPFRSSGKSSASVDARISSLKILAQSLVHEIQNLEAEAEDAGGLPDALDLQAEVRRFEAELIRSALVRTQGRQRRAARLLGMKVTTLNAKIRRYKIG